MGTNSTIDEGRAYNVRVFDGDPAMHSGVDTLREYTAEGDSLAEVVADECEIIAAGVADGASVWVQIEGPDGIADVRRVTADAADLEQEVVEREVERAIERSISHDEIVTLTYDRESVSYRTAIDELLGASDDSVENGDVYEFWGTDDDGDDWRVHVRQAHNAFGGAL